MCSWSDEVGKVLLHIAWPFPLARYILVDGEDARLVACCLQCRREFCLNDETLGLSIQFRLPILPLAVQCTLSRYPWKIHVNRKCTSDHGNASSKAEEYRLRNSSWNSRKHQTGSARPSRIAYLISGKNKSFYSVLCESLLLTSLIPCNYERLKVIHWNLFPSARTFAEFGYQSNSQGLCPKVYEWFLRLLLAGRTDFSEILQSKCWRAERRIL
jgi:hypothetical protein